MSEFSTFSLAPINTVDPTTLQALQQDIQIRDQLVKQLSEEMYRLMLNKPELFLQFYQARQDAKQAQKVTEETLHQLNELQQQALALTDQLAFYQAQIEERDQEIMQRDREIQRLQQSLQEFNERNQMLEKVIQEMPEVYRQKFSQRLEQVKVKLENLEFENQRLKAQLRQAHHPVSNGPRNGLNLELPSLQEFGQGRLMPSLG